MDTKRSNRQRIRRSELVQFVFSMFSQRYERSSVDSIQDIQIPIAEVRKKLSESYDTAYQNDWWILTQIHRYERETGTRLFERVGSQTDPNEITLAIYQGIDGFWGNHHLLVNQKLRIAKGVLDLITNTSESSREPLSLFLGSGSIPTMVADVLVHKIMEHGGAYRIFSHNLAVQEKALAAARMGGRIDFYAVGGRVDSIKFISLTDNMADYVDENLAFVIQSTNTIAGETLYVDDPDEARMKDTILHDLPGVRVLVLMKDEFARSSHGKHAYGRLRDYDYLVTIPSRNGTTRKADIFLDGRSDDFVRYVTHWSYTIYRIAPYPEPRHRPYGTEPAVTTAAIAGAH